MSDVILNLLPLTDQERAAFTAAAPDCVQRFLPCMDPKGGAIPFEHPEYLEDVTVLLGNLSPAVLAKATRLNWLQTWSAGVDAFLPSGVLPEHAVLTSAVGAYGPSVAEHMFAMLLSLLKQLPLYRDEQSRRDWADLGPVKSFAGLKVLVVGAGDIGLKFAGLCRAVGMYTTGLKRTASGCPPELNEVHPLAELDAWLPWADVVLLVLPQAPETIHLMDARPLTPMRWPPPWKTALSAARPLTSPSRSPCPGSIHFGPNPTASLPPMWRGASTWRGPEGASWALRWRT